jgi:hypothetical protein
VGYVFFEIYDERQKIKCLEGQKMEFKSPEEIKRLKVIPRHDEFALKAVRVSGS